MEKGLVLFIFLLLGCGGDAAAKPCIPVDVVKFKTPGANIAQTDAKLSQVLAESRKFVNKNLGFVNLCFVSNNNLTVPDMAYVNSLQNYYAVFNYWFISLRKAFQFGHVTLGVHPVSKPSNAAGRAIQESYLDATYPAFAIAWCGRDSLICKVIVIHELLHTMGASHVKDRSIMYSYLIGAEQLVMSAPTKTEVRRYLKRKGLIKNR